MRKSTFLLVLLALGLTMAACGGIGMPRDDEWSALSINNKDGLSSTFFDGDRTTSLARSTGQIANPAKVAELRRQNVGAKLTAALRRGDVYFESELLQTARDVRWLTRAEINPRPTQDTRDHAAVLAESAPISVLTAAVEAGQLWSATFAALALGELGEKGEEALPSLIKALQSRSPAVRIAVFDAIGSIGITNHNVSLAVQQGLQDRNEGVVAGAVRAIGRLESVIPDATAVLIQLLTHEEEVIAFEAAVALGELGGKPSKQTTAALNKALNTKNKYWNTDLPRAGAAMALAQLGAKDKKTIKGMINLLDKRYTQGVNSLAMMALATVGKPAINPLLSAANGRDPILSIAALRTIYIMGPVGKDAIKGLEKATKHRWASTRWTAALTLGGLGNDAKRSTGTLVTLLKSDPVREVAEAAAVALEQIGDTGAAKSLLNIIKDPAAPVYSRSLASPLAAKWDPSNPQLVTALIQALKAPDAELRQAAATALGLMGPNAASAITDLEIAKDDPARLVRQAAEEAIRLIKY